MYTRETQSWWNILITNVPVYGNSPSVHSHSPPPGGQRQPSPPLSSRSVCLLVPPDQWGKSTLGLLVCVCVCVCVRWQSVAHDGKQDSLSDLCWIVSNPLIPRAVFIRHHSVGHPGSHCVPHHLQHTHQPLLHLHQHNYFNGLVWHIKAENYQVCTHYVTKELNKKDTNICKLSFGKKRIRNGQTICPEVILRNAIKSEQNFVSTFDNKVIQNAWCMHSMVKVTILWALIGYAMTAICF